MDDWPGPDHTDWGQDIYLPNFVSYSPSSVTFNSSLILFGGTTDSNNAALNSYNDLYAFSFARESAGISERLASLAAALVNDNQFRLAAVAGAISLTTFMRRPEYLATGPTPAAIPAPGGGSPLARVVRLVEAGGRWVVHYPSYFLYLALLDFVEGYFFVYIAAHVLYLGRALLQIILRLGRTAATPPAVLSREEQK